MPFWAKLIVVLGALWLPLSQSYAVTDVGTAIVNQATLTYTDKATGQLVELKSNTSTILVAPLRQFELLSPNSVAAFAGQSVALSHSINNIGNVDDRYAISVENQLADSGDLINLILYIDSNENGAVDAGEPVVDSELSVAAGESVSLVITGVLPEELSGNDEVEVLLHAQAVESDLPIQTNINLITITPSANISLELQSSSSCDVASSPGDSIEFDLRATNQSDTLPNERSITVDGAERTGVLLEVGVPAGLSLVAGEILDIVAFQGIAIVNENSTGNEWMRYEQWTGETTIERIALLAPADNFTEQDPVSLSFSMLVDETQVDSKLQVNATIDFDSDLVVDVEAEPACVNVVALGAVVARELRFVEPSIELQKAMQTPDFAENEDFVDAPVYRLQQSDIDNDQIKGRYCSCSIRVDS